MYSPLDTHISYFGGKYNPAVLAGITKLVGAGYDVICAKHDPREIVTLREAGIATVDDRVEALDDCQIVLTCQRTPDDVEELYLGDDGLLELASPGTRILDLSFTSPRLAREIQALGAIADIDAIDAPIVNLGEGEQTICFLGGTKEAQNAISPLLPYLAQTVYSQSNYGEGQFAAMVSYIALAGTIMGTVEAIAMAHICGFAQSAALSALATTAGGSRALVEYVPRILAHDFSGHIKVTDFLDALEVALDTADALDVTLPMVETAYQLYDLLSVVGGDELNIQAIALLYEDEKTCAEYGLDWALAETAGGGRGTLGDMNIEDFFRHEFDDGDDDNDADDGDDKWNGTSGGPIGGPGSIGGIPGVGGFFSKN